MTLAPGALCQVGNSIFVVRCRTARPGWWLLAGKIDGVPYITRVEQASALRVVKPAPVYQPAEKVLYEGRRATVDRGEEVDIVADDLSKITAHKADLVIEQL